MIALRILLRLGQKRIPTNSAQRKPLVAVEAVGRVDLEVRLALRVVQPLVHLGGAEPPLGPIGSRAVVVRIHGAMVFAGGSPL